MTDRLDAQIAFLNEADKLKTVIRATEICDGSRHESSAEHSWRNFNVSETMISEKVGTKIAIGAPALWRYAQSRINRFLAARDGGS